MIIFWADNTPHALRVANKWTETSKC